MSARVAAALAGTLLAAAAPPPVAVSTDELAQPLPLAERLLGEPASRFREAQVRWNPGVAQYGSVTVLFAMAAEPTDYTGLCEVRLHSAQLAFVEPRTQTSGLVLASRHAGQLWALAAAQPALARRTPGTDTSCASLGLFLNRPKWQLAAVRSGTEDGGPATAAFAFRAVLAAKAAPVKPARDCTSNEIACRKPKRFLKELDPRALYELAVAPCAAARWLCVTAKLESTTSSGAVVLTIETRSATEAGPVTVRSVTISRYEYPVA